MFTSLTLSAVAILHAISMVEFEKPPHSQPLSSPETCVLLDRLTSGGLIHLISDKPRGYLMSYRLAQPLGKITLLSLLDAIGESLNNVHVVDSNFYSNYGLAARKLGVINQVTRTCLSEINVSDIPVRQKQRHT